MNNNIGHLICDCGGYLTLQTIESSQSNEVLSISIPELLIKRCMSKDGDIYDLLDESIKQKINDIISNKKQLILLYNIETNNGIEPMILSRMRELFIGNIYAIYPSLEAFAEDFPENIKTISSGFSLISSHNFIVGYDPIPSEIISDINGWKLYLSSESVATDINLLKKFNITSIVTIRDRQCEMKDHPDFSHIVFKHVDIIDRPHIDIKQYFSDTFDFIDKMKQEKRNVLIHCHAGISRSATMVIAYIMQSEKKSLGEVYKFVLSKRRQISPNMGFMGQLIIFNTELGFTFKLDELI
jgi:protein-tyrosine phosphatase